MKQSAWVISSLLFVSFVGIAHEIRPAYVEISELPDDIYQITFHQPRIKDRFLDLQLSFSCTQIGESSVDLGVSSVQESMTFSCKNGLHGESLTILGLQRTMTNALVRLVPLDGDQTTILIHPDSPSITLGEDVPLPAYLTLGIEHLLLGIDHVLFVLGLLYLVSGTWRLVQTITSFTVAHSITLALSVTGLIELSQGMVEALIALTILYLAVEIANRDGPMEYPGVIAFIFGLLHGLGFAGALREIGLPEDVMFMSLLLFNVGIELGQLLVIVTALSLAWLVHRVGPIAMKRVPVLKWIPVYFMGTISVYWVITRTAGLLYPSIAS